ncbi:hypothetical protein BGW41_004535 [Actinomortierella wolfii]|nr:hypothetical protein BGW41_004535 [Actinomortierella wolfii]
MVRHRSDSNHRYRSTQAVPDSPKTPRTPPSSTRVLRSPSSRHRNSLYTPIHSIHQQQRSPQQHQHQHLQQQQPILRRYYSRPDDEADSDGGNLLESNTANKSSSFQAVPGWSDTTVGGDLYQSANGSLLALGNNNNNNKDSSSGIGRTIRSAKTKGRTPSPPSTLSSFTSTSRLPRPSTRSRVRHQQLDALDNCTPSTPKSSSSSASSSTSSSPFSQADQGQTMDISPNAQPTPSELLSMDLNVLKLASATSTPTSVRHVVVDPFTFSGAPKSPSRSSSSSRAMLTSIHRYPTRTPPKPYTTASVSPRRSQNVQTPNKNLSNKAQSDEPSSSTGSPFLVSASTPTKSPSAAAAAAAAMSPGRNVGKFMADEDHNLFLTSSPKAVRTPRKAAVSMANTLLTSPVPQPRLFSPHRTGAAESSAAGSSSSSNEVTKAVPFTIYPDDDDDDDDADSEHDREDVWLRKRRTGRSSGTNGDDANVTAGDVNDGEHDEVDDDDKVETESLPSSVGGETEKENQTPKFSDDGPTFFIGGPYSKRPAVGGYGSTPAGWTLGYSSSASSSASAAASASASSGPSCSTPSGSEGVSKPGVITRSKRNALGTISPWRWNSVLADQIIAMYTKGCKAGSSSEASCSSSCNTNGATTTDDTNTPNNASSSSSLPPTTAGASSSSCAGSSSSSSSSKKIKIPELPSITPNPQLAKMAEAAVQPSVAAFTRRAQKVAGRIYYWKHGGYHLVSDQDKQSWPGEWKFEIFQDPDSPVSTFDGNSNANGGVSGEDRPSRHGSVSPPPGGYLPQHQQLNRVTSSPTLHLSHGSFDGIPVGSSSSASPSLAFGQGYPLMTSQHNNSNNYGYPSSSGNGKGKGRLVERPLSMNGGLSLSGPTAKRMRMSRDRPSASSSSSLSFMGENSSGMEFTVESMNGSCSGDAGGGDGGDSSYNQSNDGSSRGGGSDPGNLETTGSSTTTMLGLQQDISQSDLDDSLSYSSSAMDVSHEYIDVAASPGGGTPMSLTVSSPIAGTGAIAGAVSGGATASLGSSPGGSGGIRTRAGLKRSRQSDPIALKFQDRYDFRERRMLNASLVGGGGRSRRR